MRTRLGLTNMDEHLNTKPDVEDEHKKVHIMDVGTTYMDE